MCSYLAHTCVLGLILFEMVYCIGIQFEGKFEWESEGRYSLVKLHLYIQYLEGCISAIQWEFGGLPEALLHMATHENSLKLGVSFFHYSHFSVGEPHCHLACPSPPSRVPRNGIPGSSHFDIISCTVRA